MGKQSEEEEEEEEVGGGHAEYFGEWKIMENM
jgi:hypothetical protein